MRRNKYIISLLAVLAFILIFWIISLFNENILYYPKNAVNFLVSGAQKGISAAINGFSSIGGYFKNQDDLRIENAQLKAKVDELSSKENSLEEYKAENERLRKVLELKTDLRSYSTVSAQIIAKDTGNWFENFVIDKGTNDGIENGAAVITPAGLAGCVYDVGSNWAKVSAILNPQTPVSAVVTKTGDNGIVEGDMALIDRQLCIMRYLNKNANISVGDSVESSGLGGVYPRGIVIGRIKEIKDSDDGISKEALIEPACEFSNISFVLVVLR